MFNLNQALATWRQQMVSGGITSPEVLDELESHLRDDVEEQVGAGAEAEKAFDAAVRRLGPAAALKKEFTKSRLPQAAQRRKFLGYFYFMGATVAVLINLWTLLSFNLSPGGRLGAGVAIFGLYVFGLPFWLKLKNGHPGVGFLGVVKITGIIVPLWILFALLTAVRGGHWELGILPQMAMWSLCAAYAFTALAFAAGFGARGGAGGWLPPLYPVPGPIPVPTASAFSPGAQEALDVAREEALRLGHDFIGTEHVLLGMLTMAGDTLTQVFERSQVHSDEVRREIERLVSPLPAHPTKVLPPLTPRARKALQLAGAEAAALKHPLISPEHVLLGLLIEGSGVGALALKNLGIRLKWMRAELSAIWPR